MLTLMILSLLWCNLALHWLAIVQETCTSVIFKCTSEFCWGYSPYGSDSASLNLSKVFGPRKQERARRSSSLERPNSTALAKTFNSTKLMMLLLIIRLFVQYRLRDKYAKRRLILASYPPIGEVATTLAT